MKKLLFLIFLFYQATSANAEVSVWNGIHHGYSSDATTIMVTYKPSICNTVDCDFSPFGEWADVNGITAPYIAYTTTGCADGCAKCAAENRNQCVQCPTSADSIGYLSVSGSSTICKSKVTSCPAGTYLSDGSCPLCPDGTMSEAGATACTPCEAGTYAQGTKPSDHTQCTACADGTYSLEGAASCMPCSNIVVSNGKCTGCTKGGYCTTLDYDDTVATEKFCSSGCLNCDKTTGTCLACKDGYTLSGGKCTKTTPTDTLDGACPAGLTRSSDGCCCLK